MTLYVHAKEYVLLQVIPFIIKGSLLIQKKIYETIGILAKNIIILKAGRGPPFFMNSTRPHA